ncbi:unnamed protein product [Rotaria sordida]|uniref:Uncharacterized protein n=1 Tax=Rotaria sordida TaxID=392033 RepID=A0A813WX36_9BILA|nr:unnamed protein product [Rotaria sordida]
MKLDIQVTRIECELSNVCVLDIKGEEILRIVGVYASEMKPHPYTDFPPTEYDNVDEPIPEVTLDELVFTVQSKHIKGEEILRIIGVYAPESQDAKKAEIFLTWADTNFLVPFIPELSTSLRSNRIINYALAAGLSIDIHNYSVSSTLNLRNTSSPAAVLFWSKCKKYLKPLSYTVHAFIAPPGHIIKDTKEVCEVVADFYEN